MNLCSLARAGGSLCREGHDVASSFLAGGDICPAPAIDKLRSHRTVNFNKLHASRTSLHASPSVPSKKEFKGLSATENREALRKSEGENKVYKFYQADGEEVIAMVMRSIRSYKVRVSLCSKQDNLWMDWSMFRSRSFNWEGALLKDLPASTVVMDDKYRSKFQKIDMHVHVVELELSLSYAPFFITFAIFPEGNKELNVTLSREVSRDPCFLLPVGCGKGRPEPLGSTVQSNGTINFALYSKHADAVVLCLYHAGDTQPAVELELHSSINRTGSTWHMELEDGGYDRYGYRCIGECSWDKGNRFHPRRVLLDPYAKTIAPFVPGQDSLPTPAAVLSSLSKDDKQFDWGNDLHPDIPLEDLIVYRLNVTGFTADTSSALDDSTLGTFDGLVHKTQHFKSLGVNCIILQPIFFFQKRRNSFYPLSFFAPMDCFGPEKTSASSSKSLKRAIRELHKNQIEVVLDVVFSHTGENNDKAPETVSFRGIDNATYYILDQTGRTIEADLGAENSFSCNHPVAHTMILDSLRHWVTQYHVDGFCFLNASALMKGPHGQDLSRPLLVEAITFDPILGKCKLFADTSSAITGMAKDIRFPHWKRWCLWNSRFREDVRRFMRGDKGQLSRFATRLSGSGDMLADGRGPRFSMNHVTGPCGLTLVDLVSYSANIAADSEQSWNCGDEGRTLNQSVLNIRVKQVRNFLMSLFLSQGIPVLNMGDESGLSQGGNLLVNERRYFNWDALKLEFGKQTSHLIAALAAFRARRKDLFQRKEFLSLENIWWHGVQLDEPDWENLDSSFIAVSLVPEKTFVETQTLLGNIYIGFNSGRYSVTACLPELPTGMSWYRIADTSLPFPQYFHEEGVLLSYAQGENRTYDIQAYSSILLEARTMGEIQ